MREILFRGKKYKTSVFDKTDWVYGSLIDSGNHEQVTIYPWYVGASTMSVRQLVYARMEAVKPETVGQFTGLTDKNGKKIFEGDIIRYNTVNDFDCHSVVKFGEYEQDGSAGEYNPRDCIGWYVEVDNFTCPDWADDDPIYFNDYLKQQNLLEVSDECEIIGNIWDNPELLPKNSAIDAPPENP